MIKTKMHDIILVLAKREYKENAKRNLLTISAILLTTFMITTICSMGSSYWSSITQRSIMMEGMKYDIQLPEPTAEQVEKAYKMEAIETAGITVKCAIIDECNSKPTEIQLFWSDELNWEKQCIPAFEFVEGVYPKQKNEVMMSTQTLKEVGITSPKVGMEINVIYRDLVENGKTHEKKIILSGYYRDYSGRAKGFVSQKFYKDTGAKQTDYTQGCLNITLENSLYTQKEIEHLGEEFHLENNQIIYADYNLMKDFLRFAVGLLGLFFLITISGYLFIYNILYISISKKISFYGQLKMIGTTSRQIKKMLYLQVLCNSCIGIPMGILIGAAVSFFIVPSVLQLTNPMLQAATVVSFQPVVFVGAAVFSFITVFIGSRKPAVIAAAITPIEASKYITGNGRQRARKRRNGSKLCHMAWRNIFRDRKQAVIIFLSFFVALTAFLTVNIVVDRNRAENVLNTVFDYDMRILNQTKQEAIPKQIIQPLLLEQVASMEGVLKVRKVISSDAIIPYQEEALGSYFKALHDTPLAPKEYEEDLALYKEHPEDAFFMGKILGIDETGFEMLNERLGGIINKEDFILGKIGVIETFGGVSAKESVGKKVTYQLPQSEKQEEYSIVIAAEFGNSGSIDYFARGLAPSIIVSERFMSEVLADTVIELVDINYKKPLDIELDKKIKKIFSTEKFITFESKLSNYEEMKQSEDRMKVLGRGLGIILALLAILNYCNMITTSIQNRTKEFATLQSIGMTSKQLRKILIIEGMGYGVLSTLMIFFFGIPISYLIVQSMNRYEIAFAIPILTNVLLFGIFILVCILIPPAAYKMIQKDGVKE